MKKNRKKRQKKGVAVNTFRVKFISDFWEASNFAKKRIFHPSFRQNRVLMVLGMGEGGSGGPFRGPKRGVRNRASEIGCPKRGIRNRVSGIGCPEEGVRNRASGIGVKMGYCAKLQRIPTIFPIKMSKPDT